MKTYTTTIRVGKQEMPLVFNLPTTMEEIALLARLVQKKEGFTMYADLKLACFLSNSKVWLSFDYYHYENADDLINEVKLSFGDRYSDIWSNEDEDDEDEDDEDEDDEDEDDEEKGGYRASSLEDIMSALVNELHQIHLSASYINLKALKLLTPTQEEEYQRKRQAILQECRDKLTLYFKVMILDRIEDGFSENEDDEDLFFRKPMENFIYECARKLDQLPYEDF